MLWVLLRPCEALPHKQNHVQLYLHEAFGRWPGLGCSYLWRCASCPVQPSPSDDFRSFSLKKPQSPKIICCHVSVMTAFGGAHTRTGSSPSFVLDTWWELSIWNIISLSLGNFLVVDMFFWHTSTNMGFYFEHIVVLFFIHLFFFLQKLLSFSVNPSNHSHSIYQSCPFFISLLLCQEV